MFHPDPGKYVTGGYIKIGFFESDADLIFQDGVNGNLIEQIETTLDLLFTKYIKAFISYEGIDRVEIYDLTELVDKYKLLEKSGAGAGIYYHAKITHITQNNECNI